LKLSAPIRSRGGNVSKRLPATSVDFVEVAGTAVAHSLAQPHPAPCRQYVIVLEGEVEVTTSDGESRVVGSGEVVLVEDTHGKGHITKILGRGLHRGIFIPIDWPTRVARGLEESPPSRRAATGRGALINTAGPIAGSTALAPCSMTVPPNFIRGIAGAAAAVSSRRRSGCAEHQGRRRSRPRPRRPASSTRAACGRSRPRQACR
jgi:hypothetical protein